MPDLPQPLAPLPITGVVITLNEADRIERCLRSMQALVSELVVIDSGSRDDTVARARALGARIVEQAWLGFSKQKNLAVTQARTPWVLLLDADEWLEDSARTELRDLHAQGGLEQPSIDVYTLPRQTLFLGQRMRFGSFARERVHRLFRAHIRYREASVHETLECESARTAHCPAWIAHDTARSAEEYWRKLQGYAQLWAKEQQHKGRSAPLGRASLAMFAYLVKNLIVRGGLLDGTRAWQFHWLHARYVGLKYRLLRAAS
jgi:(heptosyl)LPS beta-1,4-glucosyltransferase